jgi:hypothetical protein
MLIWISRYEISCLPYSPRITKFMKHTEGFWDVLAKISRYCLFWQCLKNVCFRRNMWPEEELSTTRSNIEIFSKRWGRIRIAALLCTLVRHPVFFTSRLLHKKLLRFAMLQVRSFYFRMAQNTNFMYSIAESISFALLDLLRAMKAGLLPHVKINFY